MEPVSTTGESYSSQPMNMIDYLRRLNLQKVLSPAPPILPSAQASQFPPNANLSQSQNDPSQQIAQQKQVAPFATSADRQGPPNPAAAPGDLTPPRFTQTSPTHPAEIDANLRLKALNEAAKPEMAMEAPPELQATTPPPTTVETTLPVNAPHVAAIQQAPQDPRAPLYRRAEELERGIPTWSEYHEQNPVSKKRHISALLASIAEGVLRKDPYAGMKMYHQIEQGPYLASIQPQQEELGRVKSILGLESEQAKAQEESAKAQADITAKGATAVKDIAEAKKFEAEATRPREWVPTTPQEYKMKARLDAEAKLFGEKKGDPRIVWTQDKNGKVSEMIAQWDANHPFTDPKTGETTFAGRFIDQQGNVIDPKAVIDFAKDDNDKSSPFAAAVQAFVRENHRKPNEQEILKIANQVKEAGTTELSRLSQELGTELKGEHLKNLRQQTERKTIIGVAREYIENPMAKSKALTANNYAQVDAIHMQLTGLHLPKPSTYQDQQISTAFEKTMQNVKRVEQILKEHPELWTTYMGPWMGRAGKVEQKFGGTIFRGASEDTIRAANELNTFLPYLMASEAANANPNGRGATTALLHLFESAAPNMKDAKPFFEGKLQALKDAAIDGYLVAGTNRYGPNFRVARPGGKGEVGKIEVRGGQTYVYNEQQDTYLPIDWNTVQ